MKCLEKFESLDCKIAIFVPGTTNINKEADNTIYIHEAAVLLSSLFGGASSSPVTGYWVSYGDQKLVQENTTIVYANCKKADLEIYIDEIVTYCLQLCKELSQDCIALEVNGTLYFIK